MRRHLETLQCLARVRVEGAGPDRDIDLCQVRVFSQWIPPALGIAQQAIGLAFDPDTHGDAQRGQFRVEQRQAEQAVLDQRSDCAADLARFVIHFSQFIADAVPGAVDGGHGVTLQGAQVFRLQRVILAELHLHLEFGQVQAVVQQLAGAVQARGHARYGGADDRLQAGAGGIQGTEEVGHDRLQVRADQVLGLVAGHELDQGGVEPFAVVPGDGAVDLERGQQAGQQRLVAQQQGAVDRALWIVQPDSPQLGAGTDRVTSLRGGFADPATQAQRHGRGVVAPGGGVVTVVVMLFNAVER
ncbi:hypothetical protein D3C84_286340 [compost metagenome]